MPELEDIPGSDRPAAGSGRRRVHRHRRRPLLLRYWWVLPLAALVAAAPAMWGWLMSPHFKSDPLVGYIADSARLEEEYRDFTGLALQDVTVVQQFDQATSLMLAGSYTNASIIMEGVSKQAAVPVVFNNLGVLYAKLKDGAHAIRAFRDALARNHDYQPVRANLKLLRMSESADPGSTELEPNDTNLQANAIWLDKPLDGAVSRASGDVDCYWFTTPRPPRDRIDVEVVNRSITLVPRLRIHDASGKLLTGVKEATGPGTNVRFDFSPPPNALYYVQVDGASGTSGAYTLTVNSLRAYDVYEPNDDILSATRIAMGQNIEANIMDSSDSDFFSFLGPEAGSVTIDIASHSATLLPGLSTFGSDLTHLGFGPDVKNPGGSIHHVMKVEANQTYYLQVWAKNDTTGPYSLIVK